MPLPVEFGIWTDYRHVYIRAPRAKTVRDVMVWISARLPHVSIPDDLELIRIELVTPPQKLKAKRYVRPR